MRDVQRALLFVSCLLWAGLAWAGMPSPREYLPTDSGSAVPAAGWEWWEAAVYFGPIAVAALLPRRWWFAMPVAFCWPFVFWLGVAVLGR